MAQLEIKNLTKYFGGLAAVKDVSFEVEQGAILGLIGPNGSGKTTIFNLISGYHPVTSGSVTFNGQEITGLKTNKLCQLGLARTFQIVKPLRRLSVLDNVIAAAYSKAHNHAQAKQVALETLEMCGLIHRKDVLAGGLPIGERKRLEITRAMATKPQVLLLDETAAGLTPTELIGAIDLIKKINQLGVTIIIVEHIMKVIMSISHNIHAINFGQTIAQGDPEFISNHPEVIKAYLGADYAES
ncbi:MAG: ABC transporter ATP-binding protein [Bdellovibrionales bacterium]|jgi:branched-chain amino acid transport system ATP-binding protein|nr:ABC transporter ATP-binding protein [Bdellovibrionales bacterium]MBT3524753.1 ABC transporter ATP-binding protein [Bdellovibrionales bacterium]MBT7669429.1 ABC transporter ATP-binding protein [Bdellovibrionales bacterium]MBT7767656.1 ABC transporter ATP-binding protein [Bdellovibrionales bacterium]